MRPRFQRLTVCLLLLACLPGSTPARVIFVQVPMPRRLAAADCAVRGKVVKVEATTFREKVDSEEREYTVYAIEVAENLLGADGLTHLRVGLCPNAVEHRLDPLAVLELKAGEEVCLLLTAHPRETFFVPMGQSVVVKQRDDKGYQKGLEELRRCARLLRDPDAGLEAKDPEDRFLTAAMLLERWRPEGSYATKSEPINARQSELILMALHDVAWDRGRDGLLPERYFGRLGLRLKDGWRRPIEIDKYEPAAKKWLKENAGTYRVQRLVHE